MRNVIIRNETESDFDAIRTLNSQAFGQDGEGRLVDALRSGGYAELSLVAMDTTASDRGSVVGHILFSRIHIDCGDREVAALSLAPMAVLPSRQRQGIGGALIREGLQRCSLSAKNAGPGIVIVLGHADYYPQFGFCASLAEPLTAPFDVPPESWMALELLPGALENVAGEVVYPPPFRDV